MNAIEDGMAAQGVIRQTLLQAANAHALEGAAAGGLREPVPELSVSDALAAGVDQTIATALSAAGYFDQVLPDTAVAAELEEKQKRLDAFLGFATRLAEIAGMQPPSDLVDGVEDLVDDVITKMLAEGGDQA